MKALVKHFWENNREEMVRKSVLNCHAVGLHSILICERPNATIRLFYATKKHNLWTNRTENEGVQSVAFHGHHCAITLVKIKGYIENWKVMPSFNEGFQCTKWLYKSKLRGDVAGFEEQEQSAIKTVSVDRVTSAGLSMRACEMHTVYAHKGSDAAWFVLEGKEWPAADSIVYSNAQLGIFDFEPLYKPMPENAIKETLKHLNLL